MQTRRPLIAVLVLVVLVLASCSSERSAHPATPSSAPTSTFVLPELEFGRGSMPPSVPATFPTPEQAVVGATMMAGPRNLTEVVLTYPADIDEVVGFYTSNLPASGYRVTGSDGTVATWMLTFGNDRLSGELRLDVVASGLTAGTLSLIHG